MEPRVVPDESLGELLRGILGDLRTLLQEEIAMARLEIRDQVMQARTAAVSLGIAVVALLLAGAFMLVAAAIAIADVLDWPVWTGFLIVAIVMSVVGLVALMSGRRKLTAITAVPEKTLSTLKENAEWISKRLTSAQR